MTKLFIPLLLTGFFIFAACNNSDNKTGDKGVLDGNNVQQALADSLEDLVWDGHDVGMAKMGKLRSMKLKAERVLDSISKLPAAARQAATPLKATLDSLVNDLASATEGMQKWMRDYGNTKDSAKNDPPQRIRFLNDEIVRVNKVRDDILQSLARADSLLK